LFAPLPSFCLRAGGIASSLLPGTLVGQDTRLAAAAAIFAASYFALAVGRVPGLAIDRPAQGAIATLQGIGASLSGLAAAEIVDHFGYSSAFLALAAAAAAALTVFALGMPETADRATDRRRPESVAGIPEVPCGMGDEWLYCRSSLARGEADEDG